MKSFLKRQQRQSPRQVGVEESTLFHRATNKQKKPRQVSPLATRAVDFASKHPESLNKKSIDDMVYKTMT